MASENETLADIIAEVRRNAESSQMGHKSFLAPRAAYWRRLAARLEAAWKRERDCLTAMQDAAVEIAEKAWKDADRRVEEVLKVRMSHVRNAAAMREALVRIKHLFRDINLCVDILGNEAYAIADAALAAPPRNCDVGTAEEQERRFREYCTTEECNRYRCGHGCKAICIDRCAVALSQMPYEAQQRGAE